jgi:hypothetical protein
MITSSLLGVLMVSPLFNIDDFRLKSLNLTLTLLLLQGFMPQNAVKVAS